MSKKLLFVGIILAILTVVLINMRISQVEASQKKFAFLQLDTTAALAAGDTINLGNLKIVYLPEDFNSLSQTAVLDSAESRTWLAGRRVTDDIASGSFLLYEHFADKPDTRFASKIGEDSRAVTIAVNSITAVAYFVEPGSTVDILGTIQEEIDVDVGDPNYNGETVRIVTKTILQNVPVLAVGSATTRGTYLRTDARRGYGTVTVEVTPLQAEILVFALGQVQSGLTLVLRNPANGETADLPSVGWDDFKAE
jgi:Flp pilus assembly protein CpaB